MWRERESLVRPWLLRLRLARLPPSPPNVLVCCVVCVPLMAEALGGVAVVTAALARLIFSHPLSNAPHRRAELPP